MRRADLKPDEQAHPERAFLVYLDQIKVELSGFRLHIEDFGVPPNGLEVIIGGNGAGKTTICDVISGKTPVTSGRVFISGEEVSRKSETEIALRGVGRKFQTPRVFNSLTVYENMELMLPHRTGVLQNLWRRTTPSERDQIQECLAGLSLVHLRHVSAGALSHGQRQWLELAMLTLAEPDLLLVDEPAAGLSPIEVEKTVEHLKNLRKKHALIVIEHNMDFVRDLGANVTFLDKGSILDDGFYHEIRNNPEVLEAYWGGRKVPC